MDNSAMVYPMVTTMTAQSIFRVGVTLNEKIDKKSLVNAVNNAILRFPYYKVELKHGLFRHFFDANTRAIIINEDDGLVLNILDTKKTNKYQFRISYFEEKIFLDIFHGLCDGYGAMEFLKSIVFCYSIEVNKPLGSDGILTTKDPIDKGETEDSFLKHYKKIDFSSGLSKMTQGVAFRVPGKKFSSAGFGLIEERMSVSKILALSKKYNCTMTVFLSALILLSTALAHKEEKNNDYGYAVFIPINLRKRFPSTTMGNFTIFAKCLVDNNTPLNLENFIAIVKEQLASQTTIEDMQVKLDFVSLMDKNPILRHTPLFIKSFFSKVGRAFPSKPSQTHIVSNLAQVKVVDPHKLIRNFSFCLNCNNSSPKNIGVVSFNDELVLNFGRKVINTKTEEYFCRWLSDNGIDVTVSSNYREDCDVL